MRTNGLSREEMNILAINQALEDIANSGIDPTPYEGTIHRVRRKPVSGKGYRDLVNSSAWKVGNDLVFNFCQANQLGGYAYTDKQHRTHYIVDAFGFEISYASTKAATEAAMAEGIATASISTSGGPEPQEFNLGDLCFNSGTISGNKGSAVAIGADTDQDHEIEQVDWDTEILVVRNTKPLELDQPMFIPKDYAVKVVIDGLTTTPTNGAVKIRPVMYGRELLISGA